MHVHLVLKDVLLHMSPVCSVTWDSLSGGCYWWSCAPRLQGDIWSVSGKCVRNYMLQLLWECVSVFDNKKNSRDWESDFQLLPCDSESVTFHQSHHWQSAERRASYCVTLALPREHITPVGSLKLAKPQKTLDKKWSGLTCQAFYALCSHRAFFWQRGAGSQFLIQKKISRIVLLLLFL